jgi:hypothetical protein
MQASAATVLAVLAISSAAVMGWVNM